MAFVSIRDDDQLLIHRDGTDYRTSFQALIESLPDGGGSIEIPGVLTYKGVKDYKSGEPPRVLGDIWLLSADVSDSNFFPPWIPGGAKNGDYLTWADDVKGDWAWRQIGNAAGIDFDEYLCKQDLLKTLDKVEQEVYKKADKDSLGDQAQIQKNADAIANLDNELRSLDEISEQRQADTNWKLTSINARLDGLQERVNALEVADRFNVGSLEVLANWH